MSGFAFVWLSYFNWKCSCFRAVSAISNSAAALVRSRSRQVRNYPETTIKSSKSLLWLIMYWQSKILLFGGEIFICNVVLACCRQDMFCKFSGAWRHQLFAWPLCDLPHWCPRTGWFSQIQMLLFPKPLQSFCILTYCTASCLASNTCNLLSAFHTISLIMFTCIIFVLDQVQYCWYCWCILQNISVVFVSVSAKQCRKSSCRVSWQIFQCTLYCKTRLFSIVHTSNFRFDKFSLTSFLCLCGRRNMPCFSLCKS